MSKRLGLVVEGGSQGVSAVADALVEAGWEVSRCPGPASARCPLLSGKRCDLAESVDATIVSVDLRGSDSGRLLRVRCAASAPAGALLMQGRSDGPKMHGRFVIVGALHSPSGIVEAVQEIHERSSARDEGRVPD